MRKILPRPLLTMILLVIWLLVQMSFSFGNILMGLILGIIIPIYAVRFWPDAPEIKSYSKLLKYIFVFLYDVIVANVQVAFWILGDKSKLKPRWVHIPMEIRHPFTITVFASTISLTPGTVSAHISANRRLLIVHCLHTDNEEETVRAIKERYESPLKEIFG